MALASGMVWEVRYEGNSLNGGGFNPASAGVDYTQQDSPQLSLTDLACTAASTTLTSVTGGFTANMVGNLIRISSGTNFTVGFYEITVYTDTNTVTLDRTPSPSLNGTAGVGRVGGAQSDFSLVGGATTASNTIYVKYSASNYVISSGISLTTGGTSSLFANIIGYDTNRNLTNTDANKPNIQISTNSTMVSLSQSYIRLRQLNLIGKYGASTYAFYGMYLSGNYYYVERCSFDNFNTASYVFDSSSRVVLGIYDCVFSNCNGVVLGGSAIDVVSGCVFKDITTNNQMSSSVTTFFNCIFDSVGTNSSTTSTLSSARSIFMNCVFYNTYAAFLSGNWNSAYNCIFSTCGTYVFNSPFTSMPDSSVAYNCAFYNYGTAIQDSENTWKLVNCQTLTADPFVDAANSNFTLNNTAGGGAECKGTGYPSAYPTLSITSYPNIGAVQDQASSGSAVRKMLLKHR